MENNKLFELRSKLSALPVLEQRMKSLCQKIYTAEEEVKSLLHKFEREALDVDQIQKDSFSNSILKLLGKFEDKANKETQEMLSAKLEYDKAVQRVNELNHERIELGNKIADLNKEKLIFEDEFRKREEFIKSKAKDQAYATYIEIENEQDMLSRQLTETNEAIGVANRVLSTASSAMKHLESAESWATYDVWSRGGIISHMAKYDHLDDAQQAFNRLSSQVKDLEKELMDVKIYASYDSLGIDSTTRVIDFWFDNIFTDLNVRDKIRGDMEELRMLYGRINSIISKLQSNRNDLQKRLSEAEGRKNELILSTEG